MNSGPRRKIQPSLAYKWVSAICFLLFFECDLFTLDEFNNALKQVSGLLEKINGDNRVQMQPTYSKATKLNDNF